MMPYLNILYLFPQFVRGNVNDLVLLIFSERGIDNWGNDRGYYGIKV